VLHSCPEGTNKTEPTRKTYIYIEIDHERGEDLPPKLLKVAPRDPIRTLHKTTSTELWDRAGSAGPDFRQYRTECPFMGVGGEAADPSPST